MVPGAEAIIDALATVGHKHGELVEVWFACRRGDDDDEWVCIERQKSLAAERVMFEMIDLARHIEFAAIHQADDRTRLIATEFDTGKRMVAIGHALVDREGIVTLELDNVAEGCKPGTGQGLYRDCVSQRSCRVS